MKMTAKFVAAGVTALALVGGVTAGIASADPTTPAPAPSATSSPTPGQTPKANKQAKKGEKRGLLARSLHGEVTVGGKETRVFDFQRGTVEKLSATEITVQSKDGFTATYAVDPKTKVRKDKKVISIGDVKTADWVRIVALKDGSTLTAKTIGDRGPK